MLTIALFFTVTGTLAKVAAIALVFASAMAMLSGALSVTGRFELVMVGFQGHLFSSLLLGTDYSEAKQATANESGG